MSAGSHRGAMLLLACAALGCGGSATPTETIVLVSAQPAVKAATAHLRLTVDGHSPGGGHFQQTIAPKWPTKLALVPEHGDATRKYTVIAEALASDQSVLTSARLISGYVKSEKRFVTLLLEDACLGVVCDDPNMSCHDSACQNAVLLPLDLGTNREKAPVAATIAHVGDAGASDAGPRDGAMPAGNSDAGSNAPDATTGAAGAASTSDAGNPSADAGKNDAGSSSRDAGNPSSDGGTSGKNEGDPCTSDSECGSHSCADHVCCRTACSDACSACNVLGHEGVCTPVPNGDPPASGHPGCGPDDVSTCQRDGTCDGNNACRLYLGSTVCGPASCDSGANMFTASSTCDGSGHCNPGSTLGCAPYVCQDASTCYASCTAGGAECSAGNVCNGNSCGLKADGASCNVDAECQNKHCADKVCCNEACTETCKTCNQGSALGICTLNPANTDPRSECPASSGPDAFCTPGKCSGTGPACNRAMTGTVCQAQKCVSGNQTGTGLCGASGVCQIPGSTPCSPYVCSTSATTCAQPCQAQSDCVPGYYCNAGTCISCVPTSSSNPVYVDPVKGVDNTSHGAQPAQCAYKTLTFALAHATGTINLLNTGSYTAATETYPITLTGSQVVNCDPNNTGTQAQFILPNTGDTMAVQMNGAGTKLLNCDVSATSNAASFSSCISIGVAGGITIDNCNLHDCAPSIGVGVAGGNLNGATITNSVITNVSNCFNQMGSVTIRNIRCGCSNDWINGCPTGTLIGSGNCCSDPNTGCGPPCNSCSCPSGFFTTPLMCP